MAGVFSVYSRYPRLDDNVWEHFIDFTLPFGGLLNIHRLLRIPAGVVVSEVILFEAGDGPAGGSFDIGFQSAMDSQESDADYWFDDFAADGGSAKRSASQAPPIKNGFESYLTLTTSAEDFTGHNVKISIRGIVTPDAKIKAQYLAVDRPTSSQ